MRGALAGLLGCIFGVIGVFALGFVFVPLAAVCAVVGLIRGISGKSAAGIGTSLLAGALSAFGFITSPSLWLLTAGLLVASQLPQAPTAAPTQHITYAPPRSRYPTPAPGASMPISPPRDVAPAPSTRQAMQQALAQAQSAMTECRNLRLSGLLKTYVESVQCSNPRVIEAFRRAHYRYMDLIGSWTAKRLELAEGEDLGKVTEAQATSQLSELYSELIDHERLRDRASMSAPNSPGGFAPAPGTPEAMQQAAAQMASAITECRNLRLSGHLKNYVASAQCSNPRIIEAYRKAGYRYMDLIVAYAAKRLELSEETDQGMLTEAQGTFQLSQFYSGLIDRQRQRDRGFR